MTDESHTPTDAAPEPVETIPKEQYFRLAADFENYRKRMEIELIDVVKFSSAKVVQEMVDVMDHMDAAVRHAPPDVRASAEWFKGLEQADAQFLETMKKFGVVRIQTEGKSFDPATMEAVTMVSGGESQMVKEEVRAGYMMHDRVIRPARVIIYQ